jgi:hypothetical protein
MSRSTSHELAVEQTRQGPRHHDQSLVIAAVELHERQPECGAIIRVGTQSGQSLYTGRGCRRARMVGSDIAHAAPPAHGAGIDHWALGSIDGHLLGSLLAGSLPGIIIGKNSTKLMVKIWAL